MASVFSDAGGDTITSAGGALLFTGVGDSFAANLAGAEVDFAGGTDLVQSTAALAAKTIGVSGGAVVTLSSNQTLTKLTEATGSVQLGANTLTLNGAGIRLACLSKRERMVCTQVGWGGQRSAARRSTVSTYPRPWTMTLDAAL